MPTINYSPLFAQTLVASDILKSPQAAQLSAADRAALQAAAAKGGVINESGTPDPAVTSAIQDAASLGYKPSSDIPYWVPLVIGAGILTAGIAAPLLGGGAAADTGATAAGDAATTGGTLASTTIGTGDIAALTGTSAATTAADLTGAGLSAADVGLTGGPGVVTGALSSSSLWDNIAKGLIPAGAQIVSSLIQAGAQKDATAAQVQAAQEALAFEEGAYNTRLSNLQPYVTEGQEAAQQLEARLGEPQTGIAPPSQPVPIVGQPTPAPAPTTTPTVTPPSPSTTSGFTTPTVTPPSPFTPSGLTNFSGLGPPPPPAPTTTSPTSTVGTVTMRAPTGEIANVPSGLVAYYQGLGAVPVGA